MTRRPARLFHPVPVLIVLSVFLAVTASADAEPEIHHVEGDVQKPVKIESPAPVYPPELKKERVEGQVIAHTVITEEGRVESVEILETPRPEFGDAVRESLAKWKFEPATLDGEPVSVFYQLTINFRLTPAGSEKEQAGVENARLLG